MKYDGEKYLEICESTARSAGDLLVDYIGRFHVHEKGQADLVTDADFASQARIKERIGEIFPDHVFLAEENTPGTSAAGGAGVMRWIVDPLDGTTNYVHGDPRFCVSMALEVDGILQVGTIYAPLMNECYTALRGRGSWLNGSRIHVSGIEEPQKSLIAVGFPPGAGYDSPDLAAFMSVLNVCHAIRRSGSTAMNLAYVAAGRYDATWNFHVCPWDVAAGALLVQESGGVVRQVCGDPLDIHQGSFLAAASEALYGAFQKRIYNVDSCVEK